MSVGLAAGLSHLPWPMIGHGLFTVNEHLFTNEQSLLPLI
jgi:hypothetical protein